MLIRIIFSILVALLLLNACQKEELPQLTITEDKLVSILLDIHIAEAAIQPLFENKKDTFATTYYDQIFKIHEFDRESFFKNISILRQNPKLTNTIYKKLSERLKEVEKMETETQEREALEKESLEREKLEKEKLEREKKAAKKK